MTSFARVALSRRLGLIFGLALAAPFGWSSSLAQPAVSLRQSFDLQVPYRPLPVFIGGKAYLVYELHFTNFAAESLALKRIEVLDSSGASLGDFQGSTLEGIVGRFDRAAPITDRLLIPPGVHALAYLSVPMPMPSPRARPVTLSHRIEYQGLGASGIDVVQGGAFTTRNELPPSVGPPLRGGPWVAIYETSWERGHRRVLYALNGSAHIPGRFAIDWMKVDGAGKYFDGDGSIAKDWYGYGADVLAVMDGKVAATSDTAAESETVLKSPARISPEKAAGNYIALDLGRGQFAFYEHLKPGSIRVKPGDLVHRGQVIALLGYTGESTGPHLHFHISDNSSPLNAEGLPYQLERFKVLGAYPSIETFAKSLPWSPVPQGAQELPQGEFPSSLAVVAFPD